MTGLAYLIGDADEYPSCDGSKDYTNIVSSSTGAFTFPNNSLEFDIKPNRKFELIEDMWNNHNSMINYSNAVSTGVLHGFFRDSAVYDKMEDYQKLTQRILNGKEQKIYLWNEARTKSGINYKRFIYGFGVDIKEIHRGGRDFNMLEYQVQFNCPDPFVYEDVMQVRGKWDIIDAGATKDFTLTGGDDVLKIFNLGSAWVEPCWVIKNNGSGNVTSIIVSESSTFAGDNKNEFQFTWTGTLPNSSNNVLFIKPRTIAEWGIYKFSVWKCGTFTGVTPDLNTGGFTTNLYDTTGWITTQLPGRMPRALAGYTSAAPQNLYLRVTGAAGIDLDVWGVYRYRWF